MSFFFTLCTFFSFCTFRAIDHPPHFSLLTPLMFTIPHLDIPGLESVEGVVQLPGSKSISNRVLMLCALSPGRTVVHDLLDSDDTQVMLEALQMLGCSTKRTGQRLEITGLDLARLQNKTLSAQETLPLFLGNAGTAMRPLTAALAALGVNCTLSGIPRMHERPIEDLVDALRQLGAHIEYLQNEGFPPLQILPSRMVVSSAVRVRGDVSSQFLTALLLALPLLSTHQDIEIEVVGELISKPYVLITLKLLAQFGVHIARDGWQRFTIAKGSHYQTPGEIYIEADASSASYFIAAAALSRGTLPLRIEGIGKNSIQGDIAFVQAARAMGATIEEGPNSLVVTPSQQPLVGIDLDCNHIPDAAMTLAIMALFAKTPTRLRNIGSWRVKETDRIAAMAHECAQLGASVTAGDDWIEIEPIAHGQWQAAAIHTYDDHRMAMCFALASLNPQHCPVRILDPRCVGKTFPHFFETLFSLARTQVARIPVICIDGPTASGKGTLASLVAKQLGYGYLDSGALYRISAWHASEQGIPLTLEHQTQIAQLVSELSLQFEGERIVVNDVEVSELIRSEAVGMAASQVSALPAVRQALFELQRNSRRLPGLVADGRDMGSVIFPDAELKIYLTADAATRAKRRHKQLISKGISAKLEDLLADLEARDARDTQRTVAPLKPAADAMLLDNAHLSIEETLEWVVAQWQSKQPF